jgi:hypothetical protein
MYEGEFRALFPNTSMPQLLNEELINAFGGDVILNGPQASGGDRYQYSQAAGVEQIDGTWYTKFVLGPVFVDGETTAAEQQTAYQAVKDAERAKAMRKQRDSLLAETDWSQGRDISEAVASVYATYRQALRDVTTQAGFPWEIQWPTKS